MRVEEGFQPQAFVEGHPYHSDPVLPALLKRLLPPSSLQGIESDLTRLGDEITASIRRLSNISHLPWLTQYDQWGARVDELQTSEGWRGLKQLAQQEGIPGIFYERKYGEFSRVYGFAKVLLMTGDSQKIFCPMSMTDGCARVLELLGSEEMKRKILPRLTSRDSTYAFTSGQWMTERSGGSDISLTETTASLSPNADDLGPEYILNGFKWFSSATDSNVAVALARTGALDSAQGTRGLSLFLVPLRYPLFPPPGAPTPLPTSNGILVHRLKNKIGTHILPTAEISIESAKGYLIGELGQGVKNITPVLNITRVHSAIASLGELRKCLSMATAYSEVRHIQGGNLALSDTPLHVAQLASISLVYRAVTHLTFGAVRLLGRVECGTATISEKKRLRLLTPIVKGFAAEHCCAAIEEAMACMGGAGYMEENDFGRAIRDALVEKIWEGTTTVLSLDLVRAAQDPETLASFTSWAEEVITSSDGGLARRVQAPISVLHVALKTVHGLFQGAVLPLMPRPALLLMGQLAACCYLLEHASWAFSNSEAGFETDIEVLRRWVDEGGIHEAMRDVDRIGEEGEREKQNLAIVYGIHRLAKL